MSCFWLLATHFCLPWIQWCMLDAFKVNNWSIYNPHWFTVNYWVTSSNYIKRLCLFVCLFVCPSRSLLRRIKSVWKAGGIVRTVLARACYIPSFKKFHARVHAISRNFHAILAISAIFGPISTCWVSKSMYSSWEIHW